MNPHRLALVAVASLSVTPMVIAQSVTYEPIPMGLTALDMSPDGRYIVGGADQNGDGFQDGSYIHDCVTNVTTILPGPGTDATAVSDDGSVILGCMPDPVDGAEVAGMYTVADGWVSLGYLPDALMCPSRSNGYDLSADGTVAVGLSWDGCSGRGFRWTEATGMQELEGLANGSNRATVCSSDGNVIGGFAQGSFSRTPAMWDGGTLAGTLLDPPDGDVVGEVQGMSDDGSILLGNWDGDAYMYTDGGGVEIIGAGSLIATWVGYAFDIADDDMIVGFDGFTTGRRAWVKPPAETELVSLTTYVNSHGGTAPATGLGVAIRVSKDGTLVVGHTFFQNAWKIIIEYCDGDLDHNGEVDFGDLLEVLAAWGPNPGHPADIDGDDVVGFPDLLIVLSTWGVCP
jgi:uncharacterized membrane protein